MKKFIVITPYWGNKLVVTIRTGKNVDEVQDEEENNYPIQPTVIELGEFQKKYAKALKEAK